MLLYQSSLYLRENRKYSIALKLPMPTLFNPAIKKNYRPWERVKGGGGREWNSKLLPLPSKEKKY